MAASIIIDAVFEDGVFRPKQPVTLNLPRTVQLVVKAPDNKQEWPSDVAEIYHELNEDDRKRANLMWHHVGKTWPRRP